MSFSLQRYFSNLFVAIIVENNSCLLLGKVIKNGHIIKTFETVFDNNDEEKIDEKVLKYLDEKEQEYNNMYIALYLNSIGQGAISGIQKKDFEKHSVDIKNVNYVAIEKSWSAYASYIDVKWAKKMFEPLQLDLLYSPFILLYQSIKKQKRIPQKPILYIYNHEDSFALGIFAGVKLLFGAFFRTKSSQDDIVDDLSMVENWDEAEEEMGIENFIELENIEEDNGLDDLEDLEDLKDLGDLEDIEDLNEIDENFNLEEEHQAFQKEYNNHKQEKDSLHDAESSIELFGRDMKMYKYLTSAIKQFYEDTIYEHAFISDIVIYDNHEVSDAIKGMMENELFMKVTIHKVKTLNLLCDLAIQDTPL